MAHTYREDWLQIESVLPIGTKLPERRPSVDELVLSIAVSLKRIADQVTPEEYIDDDERLVDVLRGIRDAIKPPG